MVSMYLTMKVGCLLFLFGCVSLSECLSEMQLDPKKLVDKLKEFIEDGLQREELQVRR